MSFEELDFQGLTPARLWRSLAAEERMLGARAFFAHAWADGSARREGELAIARALRFREDAVRKLPLDKRAGYLAKAVQPADSLAGSLLLALHLEERRALLAAFLDALGIPHENGMIAEDHDVQPPGEGALARAAEALGSRFPAREVDVYLASLLALDPETWNGVGDVLEARRATSRAAR
ncbi:MAG TPA: hypothetical protein VFV75_10535 [Candidatus Polarisedimenticolaceae bacterium]|nr:hypothetical protein [Candidatus Polarisedimenticolaceae bacterium]